MYKTFNNKTVLAIVGLSIAAILASFSTTFVSAELHISDVIPVYDYEGAEKMLDTTKNHELAIEPVTDTNVLTVYENDFENNQFVLTGIAQNEDDSHIYNYFDDSEDWWKMSYYMIELDKESMKTLKALIKKQTEPKYITIAQQLKDAELIKEDWVIKWLKT